VGFQMSRWGDQNDNVGSSNRSSAKRASRHNEWSQITPREPFKIRTSVKEAEGAHTTLELVGNPRNGVPMNIHKNEDEHFIVLEGMLQIVNDDPTLDAPAGTAVTVKKGVPHAWCRVSETPVRLLLVFLPGQIEGCLKKSSPRRVTPACPFSTSVPR
jgi:mannose-6-phosphate isomerase-like protein (cupin superfamily)